MGRVGKFGEVWRIVGKCVRNAWNQGVAWGMLGNAWKSFGEGWGDVRKAWPMPGGCLGLPGEVPGGSRSLLPTRSANLRVSLGGLGDLWECLCMLRQKGKVPNLWPLVFRSKVRCLVHNDLWSRPFMLHAGGLFFARTI